MINACRLFAAVALCLVSARAAPPFSGTIFIDRDIVTTNDPSAYLAMEDAGRGSRTMYDRRVNNWVTLNAFLFKASFDDELSIEVQVNPEFATAEAARTEALKFLPVIGQLPAALRRDVKTIWLHKGTQPFGGGNENLLIHTGQAALYIADGILEETFIHEAAHTSLDAAHARSAGWILAQQSDPEFISTYARDNPAREDIAESVLPWFAIRHRPDRISAALARTITNAIPHRIAYFDAQAFDLHPAVPPPALLFRQPILDPVTGSLTLVWTSQPGRTYAIESSTTLETWMELAAFVPSGGTETRYKIERETLLNPQFFRVRINP